MSREVTVKLIPTSFETEGTYNNRLTPENVENGCSDDDSENFATFTVSDTIYRVARYVVDTSSIPEDAEIIDVTGYAKVSINSPNNFANGNAGVTIDLDGTSFSLPGRTIENTSAEKLPLFFAYPYTSVSDMGYKRSDFNNLLVSVGGQKSGSVSDGIIYFYGASIEMTYLTDTPEPEPPTPEPPTPDMSKNVSVGPEPTDHSVMSGLRTRYSSQLSSYYSGGSIVDKLNQLIVCCGGEAHPAATITELLDVLSNYISEGSSGTPSELSMTARHAVSRMLYNLVLTAGATGTSAGYLSESDMDTVDNYILNSATDSFIAQLMTALIMDNVSTTESLSVVNQVFEYAGVNYAFPPELLEGGNDPGGK